MISGRGSNMLAIARNVNSGCLKDVGKIQTVFSNKTEAKGLAKAAELGIHSHCIPSRGKKRKTYNSLLLDWLEAENPDFIVLAGYMIILPEEIIRAFPKKIINIHPADTKQHQGLHGYEWAWENKLNKTRITVHYVNEGLDTGQIIDQREVDLTGCNSLEDVEERGLRVEHKFYSECLKRVLTAKDRNAQN